MTKLSLTVCAALLLAASVLEAATDGGAIRYVVSFPAPQSHYMEIAASYPTRGVAALEVMMPVWSPGSYLVREYSRNVESVRASSTDGKELSVTKTRKNRWRIATAGSSRVNLRYRVYGREMRVQTNFIDAEFALIQGPATFITPVDQLSSRHEVVIELPPSWKRSMSGLSLIENERNHYSARDFDELVDSPIVAGNPVVHEFKVAGVPHSLVNIGGEEFWDGTKAARDAALVVEQHRKLWGSLPYERYLFFNFIVEAGGGLEHRNSTVLMTRRFQMRTRKTYLAWLDLLSHEHFHAWNVKRLRPSELGPFDYENERYTENLWIAEGITDYYGSLELVRAGLTTREEYLEELSKYVEALQTTPGRLVQSAELASRDAWIKAYRPDENSVNTAISYYTKGSVVGFILDARIRQVTSGAKSLDDVMRLAFQRYAGARGYSTAEFLGLVREVAGANVAAWLDRATSTTEELSYDEALLWLGLEFKKDVKDPADAVTPSPVEVQEQQSSTSPAHTPRREKDLKAWLGLTTRNEIGRIIVSVVKRDTPAFAAGLNVDDEIIAIDGFRIPAESWEGRFEQYQPGAQVRITVSRRGRMNELTATLGSEPPKLWNLQVVKVPTAEQKLRLERWLGTGLGPGSGARGPE